MPFLEEVKDWTEPDAAALALGRALGVFSAATTLADARAVLGINGRAGNTLSGMLDRLVWLGVLEQDDPGKRLRAARATLHPLTAVTDVPSLQAPAPADAQIKLISDASGGARLEANRAGYRHLARVFEEIADSDGVVDVEAGWQLTADRLPGPGGTDAGLRLTLVDGAGE